MKKIQGYLIVLYTFLTTLVFLSVALGETSTLLGYETITPTRENLNIIFQQLKK
jgi:hypothetical protein